jgi:N-acetylglucosaminyldiphosphoundecaprenol N-acetyl-beta-D-mannosaminyltransferase
MRERILGYQVVTAGPAEAAEEMARWVVEGTGCRTFACINPHTYVGALAGPKVAAALHGADWLVPDGVGVVLASRLLGGALRGRITGHDVFSGVLERLNRRGTFRIFFLGSTAATLEAIRNKLAVEYPNLQVVGVLPDPAPGLDACRPPFPPMYTPEQRAKIHAAIRAARPDVLWVGMTAPKQELWIHENRADLDVRFVGAVGAVFDFYIGRIRRSSPFFLEHGLEWLPRLLQEPRRLWRRMFVSAPIFLWHVLLSRLGRSPGPDQGATP